VFRRDDLTVLYANLLVDAGRANEALGIMTTRSFQPFEGGEGLALAAYDHASVEVARALTEQSPTAAIALLRKGMEAPANLGEGRHPAGSLAERLVALGDALSRAGDGEAAAGAWNQACSEGSPLAVDPPLAGPADYWNGVACSRLGRHAEAEWIWRQLEARADELETALALPDYFATSLPELLLFDTDTAGARLETAALLRALAAEGRSHLKEKANS
jgi:hypothetical protein